MAMEIRVIVWQTRPQNHPDGVTTSTACL